MKAKPDSRQIEAVRAFNRFYTRQIGLLNEGLLRSPLSLTQVRVLYEIAHRRGPTAAELGRDLGVDRGYLSRILKGFAGRGLIHRKASADDARESALTMTRSGRRVLAPLEARSNEEVRELLDRLPPGDQAGLVEAMRRIQRLLGGSEERRGSIRLRRPRPGEWGWVIQRHGALYAREYGWNEEFEALVASIVAAFLREHDSKRERCWVAESDGDRVGCVFLVRKSEKVARLRLLLVEPSARGLGIGGQLVGECLRFAKVAGYGKITLWTNDVLSAARHIYEKAGFRLVRRQRHHSFGHELVGETWERNV